MRISARVVDNDFWRYHFERCPLVLVDGVEVKRVFEADDVAGYATIYDADAKGDMKLDGAMRVLKKTISGKVEMRGKAVT